MPHRVPEDMPDRMLEDMPDRMPEGMPDRMPDRMSARMPEDMPDKVPECLPDRMPADLPDNMPEDMLDRMPDGMPEDLPDNMPEDMPDRMPDGMPEDMPEHMPEDMPEDMPEHLPEDMPEHLPEDMPGRMPEDMPDRMPDRMPENMSDRMPEDLPVTKCINVMVGITRSKIFFLIKLGSEIPFHIPREHHTPSCTASTTTEDFHSLHRSKVSKFDGIRLYARLFKTLEKQRFPPYSILSYSRAFYLRREKKTLQVHFFKKKMFLDVCDGFYGILCLLWSTKICEYIVECDGVLWSTMTPLERDANMSMRGGKSPERRILGHNSPNSTTERMLVVVV